MKRIILLLFYVFCLFNVLKAKEFTVYYVNYLCAETILGHVWGTGGATYWPGIPAQKTSKLCCGYDVYSYTFDYDKYQNIVFNDNGEYSSDELIINASKPYFYKDKWYGSLQEIENEEEAEVKIDGLKYSLDINNKVAEVAYIGQYLNKIDVTIPETVTYGSQVYSVKSICNRAFYKCTTLKSIKIPSSIISIGDNAFEGCDGITKVNYLGTVDKWVSIDFKSFESNPTYYAKDLYINDKLLTDVKIISADSIKQYAFYNCQSIKSVEINSDVASIGYYAFLGCSGITKVNYLGTIDKWAVIDFSSAFSNPTLYAKDLYINSKLLTDVKIISADSIKQYAFYNCQSIKSVEINSDVASIGYYAFLGCSGITKVNYLGTIDKWAVIDFSSASSNPTLYAKDLYINSKLLTEVRLTSANSISRNAFYDCQSIKSVEINSDVASIGYDAFFGCSGITKVNYLGAVEKWAEIKFENTQSNPTNYAKDLYLNNELLTDVKIISVNSIGRDAFYGCKSIKSVEIGKEVTSIGSGAFSGCTALSYFVVSPENLNYLSDDGVLYDKATYSLLKYPEGKTSEIFVIPAGMTSVDSNIDCKFIASIVFHSNVSYISSSAFDSCDNLSEFIVAKENNNYASENGVLFNKDKTSLIRYPVGNKEASYTIPKSVTYIGFYAFYNCSNLVSVIIPTSVTYIGSGAFEDCNALTSVTIPNSVTYIEENAFSNTALYNEESNWKDGVLYIDNCLIKAKENVSGSYSIKEGTRVIAAGAFSFCSNLTSVAIPNSITLINGTAFKYCDGLKSVIWNAKNYKDFYSSDSTPFYHIREQISSFKFGNEVEHIPAYLCYGIDKLTEITVPNSVTSIGSNAFYGCVSLMKVINSSNLNIIPGKENHGYVSYYADSVENIIDDFLFDENDIIIAYVGDNNNTSITIPEKTKGFKEDVFSDCKNVKSIIWKANNYANFTESLEERPELEKPGEGKVTICVQAPQNLCGYIVAPGTITDWEPGSGENKRLDLVDGYSTWYSGTFDWEDSGECRFKIAATDINGDWDWDYQAYHYEILEGDCKEVSVYDDIYIYSDNQVIYIKIIDFQTNPCAISSPFSSIAENINSFTIVDGVTQIPNNLCKDMINLRELNIGNSVETIGISSFENCQSLESINLPSSVKSINSSAFYNCTSIQKVNFLGSLDEWLNIAFYSYGSNPLCYGKNLYFNNELLSELNINKVGHIYPYAFINCQNIKKVNIGEGVTDIHNAAFSGCSSLISVSLPNSLTTIGESVFTGCSALESIIIPNSVTSIGGNAFSGCSSLTSFIIPNNIERIRNSMFNGCINLYSVVIPNSVKYIEDGSFYGCTNLKTLTIPESVVYIGSNVLTHTGLYNDDNNWEDGYLYVSNHIVDTKADKIGKTCFIKKETRSIAKEAFYGCTEITTVYWNARNCPFIRYSSDYPPFFNVRKQISSIKFGDEVEHIPSNLCEGMDKVNEISIPKSVNSIGRSAFYGTGFYNTDSNWDNGVLYIDNCLIKGENVTGEFKIKEGTRVIADNAFDNNNKITSIYIPTTVSQIGAYAFEDCYKLKEVYNASNLEIIKGSSEHGYVAYYADIVRSEREGFVIENQVIIDYVGDLMATNITIPEEVVSINNGIIDKFNNVDIIVWKAKNFISSNEFSLSPFYNQRENITSFTFGDKVETIPSYLCYGMKGLKDINIPHSVTSIGSNTFNGCTDLRTITIGEGVESIGENAFAGCKNLKKVTAYPMSVPEVENEDVFANYNAYLYVPCDVHEDYDLDDVFGNFKYIKCIESEEVDAPEKVEIEVDEDNNATVTWPSTDGANSYELVISKNGEVFCTLLFNENGQLTSIDFANRSASVGFQFIVTGLDGASKYKYQMTAIDKKGNEITSYKGVFATNGYEGSLEDDEEDEPTDVVETLADANITISDGLITCPDAEFTIYNTLGQDVTAYNGSLQPGVYVVSVADDVVKVMMK